ncbi:MAG: ComEC/Rec2 family competence protein, partial [Candidatus Acidiferrales bacterium]
AERWPGSVRLWVAAATVAILLGVGLALLVGAGFARRHFVTFAWICALAAWLALGGLARCVELAGIPSNHITRLIAADKIDTSVALRWRGRLREDPLALPWGQRFEIDLERVEAGGVEMPVSGGLRVNFYSNERAARPPEGLRAGDRVEALVKARPPRDFLDPGAFDVHGFLARQKIAGARDAFGAN